MIEVARIVEHQVSLSSYRATQNEERAVELELLIESTKPAMSHLEWHPLIMTPFRYPPPHPQGRFRPAYGKNVFYGSLTEETALYEQSYYLIKQRAHLAIETETGVRTIFFAEVDDSSATDIRNHSNLSALLDKHNYSASHQFVETNPDLSLILYPSCRDPKMRNNVAILDINLLGKNPKWESSIKFFYDNRLQQITWLDHKLHVLWSEVA